MKIQDLQTKGERDSVARARQAIDNSKVICFECQKRITGATGLGFFGFGPATSVNLKCFLCERDIRSGCLVFPANAPQRQPMQPIVRTSEGARGLRFHPNQIVQDLLENASKHGFDLNHIAGQPYCQEDRQQFAQLIGYSLTGYGELSYVSDESYDMAEKVATEGKTPQQARLDVMESTLAKVRVQLKCLVPELFKIHPDDLTT